MLLRTMRFLVSAAALLEPAFAADDADARALPDGQGKDVTARICIGCHDSGNFRKRRLSQDRWTEKIADMVERGARGSEAELAAVADYLAQNFGPDSKLRVNTAPMPELKAVLGITAQQAQALIAWREANGDFRKWQDLSKALGADGGKIESKKDLMVF